MTKKCKICKSVFEGRSNKLFCSVNCKNSYHIKLRQITKDQAKQIDEILHRNRSILLELLGKKVIQKKMKRLDLEKKNFQFKYITHFHINSQGKMYHHVYDFAWMEFSDDEILVLKR